MNGVEMLRRDGYVHAPWVRWGALTATAVMAMAAGLVATHANTPREYLTVWTAVGIPMIIPTLVLAPRALRDTDLDRTSLRAWYAGMATAYVGCALVYVVAVRGWGPGKPLILLLTVAGIAAFGVGNALALRARSGQRTMLVDLFDMLVATAALVGPFALLALEPIVTSGWAWLAIPSAFVMAGGLHAVGTSALRHMRSWQPHGFGSNVCLAVCAVTVVDAIGQIVQCLTHFGLPPGPLIALHVVTMSNGMLTGATMQRNGAQGLALLPPQRQVRKSGPLAGLVLTSVVAMLAIAAWRHDDGWTVGTAVAMLAGLAVLATLRQVGLAQETVRLYGAVERAADERRELLADVMRYIDADRTRAAAQIHRQAARLYTSVALSSPTDSSASQVRVDLARQVDLASEVLIAMQSTPGPPAGLERLAGLIRAYVGTLYGDGVMPMLEIDIADGLVADWLDEAVAFRIVQLALHNVWRHAEAATTTVCMHEHDAALVVAVTDDGLGFDPATAVGPRRLATASNSNGNGRHNGNGAEAEPDDEASGFATIRALAQLVGGQVQVDSTPGDGTRVTAVLAGAPSPARATSPKLRVISGGISPETTPPART
jgi:histidine kinase/DNA gyrase B/HSP90-like ATPase